MVKLCDQNAEIVNQWIDMFNARDVQGMVGLYADKSEHTSPRIMEVYPKTFGTIYGKEPLRRWWRECFEESIHLNYELIELVSGDTTAVLNYIRHGDEVPSRHKLYFEFKDGKITKSRIENLPAGKANAARPPLSLV